MIDSRGSFDKAAQIVLTAMNDVNLIMRHNGLREWSVRTEVKQVTSGVVTSTNTLRDVLDQYVTPQKFDIYLT